MFYLSWKDHLWKSLNVDAWSEACFKKKKSKTLCCSGYRSLSSFLVPFSFVKREILHIFLCLHHFYALLCTKFHLKYAFIYFNFITVQFPNIATAVGLNCIPDGIKAQNTTTQIRKQMHTLSQEIPWLKCVTTGLYTISQHGRLQFKYATNIWQRDFTG